LEPFPFIKLPPELRRMVYHFALRDTVDPIMFPGSEYARKPHLSEGTLALLCTNKQLRTESLDAMWKIAGQYFNFLHDAFKTVMQRTREVTDSTTFGSPAYEQADDDFNRANRQATCITVVTRALARASRADHAYQWAERNKIKTKIASKSYRKATG